MAEPTRITNLPRRLAGIPNSTNSVEFTCHKCRDRGGDWADADGFGLVYFHKFCDCDKGADVARIYAEQRAEAETKYKATLTEKAFENSGIPFRYLDAELNQFKAGAAMKQVTDWLASGPFTHRRSLLVHGEIGTGKTHLAVALLRKIIPEAQTGYFVSVIELLDRIRASFGDNGRDGDELLNRVKTERVLVLDDLGAERVGEGWVADRLLAVVNARYNEMLVTITTSNYRPTLIAEHLGEPNGARIVSRLAEGCTIVHLTGKDRRLNGQ